MQVLIKSIKDRDGSGAVEHSSGKFAYGYTLTLFLVKDGSTKLAGVTTDSVISRMAAGLGWSDNKFNGAQNLQAALDFIRLARS
jgi:hypothetical protein